MKESKILGLALLIILCVVIYYIIYTIFVLQTTYVKSEIHFGRNYVDGSELSSEIFNKFLHDTITPLFKNGLTVYESYGQMFDGKKIEKQKNFVVVIVHKNDNQNKQNIVKIINLFKNEHKDLQVMKIEENVSVKFYNR